MYTVSVPLQMKLSDYPDVCHHIAAWLLPAGSHVGVQTWCAVSPEAYRAAIVNNKEGDWLPSAKRLPTKPDQVSNGQPTVRVRVERAGVALNRSQRLEEASAVTCHIQMMQLLWGIVAVHLVCLDLERTDLLLRSWQHTVANVRVCHLQTKHLAKLLGPFKRESGAVFSSLRGLQHLVLLTTSPADVLLPDVGPFTQLETLYAPQQPIASLASVAALTHLHTVDVSSSAVADADVVVLSKLPALRQLNLNHCTNITNLNPLANAAALEELCAMSCTDLRHFEHLGRCNRLRVLDLSENVLPAAKLAALLENPDCPVEKLVLNCLHFPTHPPTRERMLCGVKQLYVIGAHIPTIDWLCFMGQLEFLILDLVEVTDAQLERLAVHQPYLQVLSACGCPSLSTSLRFAFRLPRLTVLDVPESSINQTDNCLEELRERGLSMSRRTLP